MPQQIRVAIVAAQRTAIGSFLGSLQSLSAADLGSHVIKSLLDDSKLSADLVDDVFMGQVYTAAAGPNPARQAALQAGLPHNCTATTINMVCGSGLRSIQLAAQSIQCGQADCIIAGGMESMSQVPFLAPDMRSGKKLGNTTFIDGLIHDALWDPFYDCHMGQTAENLAETYNISREDQDAYAALSQQRYASAQHAHGFQSEITALSIPQRKGDALVIDRDEYPKAGVTVDSIKHLRPAFLKDGTVTAANASGINDGAAAVLLMSEAAAKKHQLKPVAYLTAHTHAGVDPRIMGIGPAFAVKKLLDQQELNNNDIDVWEINEAFAAQVLAVNKELGLDSADININGGAIALGHPVGASGARIVVTLIHEMLRQQKVTDTKLRGIASLCIGGGMGIASLLETA